MLSLLLACAAAWRPDVAGRFDLQVPTGWSVTHNARSFGNDHLLLSHAGSRSTISIELVVADSDSRRLPLDLLAEVRAVSAGRSLGVENTRERMDQLEIDGHEAWAVTGRRRWRLITADYTMAVLRVGNRICILTLQAPSGELDAALYAWSIVLSTVRFPLDHIPADAPTFPPEP